MPETRIDIGIKREHMRSWLREASDVIDKAEASGLDFTLELRGLSNDQGHEPVEISISNDDMERPEVEEDAVCVEVSRHV